MPDAQPLRSASEMSPEEKRLALKRREDGIRAQAIRQGRETERAELLRAIGAKAIDEVGLLPTMQKTHSEELERQRHMVAGRAWWRGIAIGMSFSVILGCAGVWAGYMLAERGMMALVAADRARTARASLPAELEPMAPGYELNAREPGNAQP